jgi:hypothetical protein
MDKTDEKTRSCFEESKFKNPIKSGEMSVRQDSTSTPTSPPPKQKEGSREGERSIAQKI